MKHAHYYRVSATSHFELGYKLGKLFKSPSLHAYHSILKQVSLNKNILQNAHTYLQVTQHHFPQYVEELKGYAKGIDVDFASYWLVFLNEELDVYAERCTSIITNSGLLIGHNEDFNEYYKKRLALVEKTLNDITILELFYYNGLGGTTIGINSHGIVQTINTLHHTDERIGVPRNLIGRWLSETKDPEADYKKMIRIIRSLGYAHNFSSLQGQVSFIESTANAAEFHTASVPHVHTNHYVTNLKIYEKETLRETGDTFHRYACAKEFTKSTMTVPELQHALELASPTPAKEKEGNVTVARVIIDLKAKDWWCWLAREKSKGWMRYPIRFL